MKRDGQPHRRGCGALFVLLASRCDAKTWCDPAGTIARRNGSIALLRKHSKASSSFALSFVRAHAGKWRRKQDNSKAIVVDSPAAEDKWRRRDDDYADDTFLWPQEANATDARCLPVFEREGVLLATSLRTPYNRTAAAFLASPDPANFTATDNAYVRAFNGRCLGPLSLETCLRGCPGPRGAVTRDDLERAKELLASFDVVFFTEDLPRFGTHVVHPRPQSRARKGGQAPELPPADAALVRAVDPYDDELYAWALRRHASCGSPADARPSH